MASLVDIRDIGTEARAGFIKAFEAGKFAAAANIMLLDAVQRAHFVACHEDADFDWPKPDLTRADDFWRMVSDRLNQVQSERAAGLRLVEHLLSDICWLKSVLDSADAIQQDNIAQLTIRSFQMGSNYRLAAHLESGLLQDYGQAVWVRKRNGDSRRDMVPKWEAEFEPIALELCAQDPKMNMAELVRRAREWGNTALGRKTSPPADDSGFKKGLQRMETRGLVIPNKGSRYK